MVVNALSNYTGWLYTHSIDVALISLMIAVDLGYTNEELVRLGIGAFLHDSGELLVPRDIMQKTGALTDMDRAYIRQHCELGASSLEPFNLPKECIDIVLQHHERLDGSGYPAGLMEEEITQEAMIVAIADVVDAITTDRPYRPRRDINVAISELKNGGVTFSQDLVLTLEKLIG